MLFKTVVDETVEGAETYKSWCWTEVSKEDQEFELKLIAAEYDDAFVEAVSKVISEYYIHSVFTYDYESSSDAGDGRDDYYTEEEDFSIELNKCIIKENKLFGVICEAFERQTFMLVDFPETSISHPDNYGGRNYHFYRGKKFKLVRNV